jgi:hypothetical protein
MRLPIKKKTFRLSAKLTYESFLEHCPCLHHLLRTIAMASANIRSKREVPIISLKVSDTIPVDLRFYRHKGYDEDLILLPNRFDKKYVVEYEVLTIDKKLI